jgi:inward rectifier potassium channel
MAVAKIREHLTTRRPARPRERSINGRRIIADGLAHTGWNDFYHNALIASWPRFFGVLAAAFLTLNGFFALVYWFGDAPVANARPGSFADLFFFSVETTSTVGYGDMHPQTMYGHLVATVENFVGLVLLAVMTGLVFSRFSRPRARMIFARNPVITDHEGARTLVFRLANARFSFISEATAKLWMLGPTETREGRRFVGFFPMKLSKSENPSFALSWTLFHPIDADSPIHALDDDDLAASEINFVLSISGFDETSAQMVHARETFSARDVRPGHEYVDLFTVDDEGRRHIDYAVVHETRPVPRAADPIE